VVSEGTIETGRFYGWADFAAPEQAPMLRIRFIPPPPDSTGPPPGGENFALLPPTPNPFRDTSTITFSLAAASDVRLTIHDAAGRLVRRLVDGWQESGAHQTSWDGRAGDTIAGPGVYFLRLEASGRTATGRIVRLQ
jgi:hypothetical protein